MLKMFKGANVSVLYDIFEFYMIWFFKESVYKIFKILCKMWYIYMFIYILRYDYLIVFFRMFGVVEYILFSSWCVFVILM